MKTIKTFTIILIAFITCIIAGVYQLPHPKVNLKKNKFKYRRTNASFHMGKSRRIKNVYG